jgi:hypothetical protein
MVTPQRMEHPRLMWARELTNGRKLTPTCWATLVSVRQSMNVPLRTLLRLAARAKKRSLTSFQGESDAAVASRLVVAMRPGPDVLGAPLVRLSSKSAW